MKNRTQWKIVGRGKVGWHADGITSDGHKVSGSGGDLKGYREESGEGVLVYDAKEANDGDFVAMVYGGPICDPTLKDGEVHKFGDKVALAHMLPGLGGAFATIGVMALLEDNENRIGSMDMVSTDIYISMLKAKVRGIKLGRVNDKHEVIWE